MRNERVLLYRVMSLALLILVSVGRGIGSAEEEKEAEEVETVTGNHFPYPVSLRPQVEFWKKSSQHIQSFSRLSTTPRV